MEQIYSEKSVMRWLRQCCFLPFFQQTWLNSTSKQRLQHAIEQAEQQHHGEIVLIIENNLPLTTAYQQDCRARAVDLFGLYRIWDTEYNSGILIYLNLCEHQLHILADRGIHTIIQTQTWQQLCEKTLAQFKQNQHIPALEQLIADIATLLQHYHLEHAMSDIQNELPDHVIHLT